MEFWILVGLVAVCWAETDPYQLCIENEDCPDPDNQCCVYHPKYGVEFGICTAMSGLGAMCQQSHKRSRSYDYFCPCDERLFECKTVGTWSPDMNTKYDIDFCFTKNKTDLNDEDKPNWHHPKSDEDDDDDDDSDKKHHHKKTDGDDDSDRKHHHKKTDSKEDSGRKHHKKTSDEDSDKKHDKKTNEDDDDDSHRKHHKKIGGDDDDDDSDKNQHKKTDEEDDSNRKHHKKHDDDDDKEKDSGNDVMPPPSEILQPDIYGPEPEE